MIIAGGTLNQTPIDWNNNLNNILEVINDAKAKKVEFLCLPELAITGYGCEDLFLTDWLIETGIEKLKQIIPQTQNITVTIGLPLILNNHRYNCICVIKDNEILGFSAKQFLANDGVHYEKRWFEAWPQGKEATINIDKRNYPFGDIVYDIDGKKVGLEICEDAWNNDRPAVNHHQRGVSLILNPSASPFTMSKSDRRIAMVMQSSAKFDCTYVYTNLLGNEAGKIIFDGEILIAQKGKLIARNERLSFKNYNIQVADTENIKEGDSSSDLSKEASMNKAAALGLFDYLRKSRSNGFVLSLSGGADSSACAILVAEAVHLGLNELGLDTFLNKINRADLAKEIRDASIQSPEELRKFIVKILLTTAYQGTKNSSQDTYNSAKRLAESIGATFYAWEIDKEVHSYTEKIENAIGRKLSWETDDIALQNIQARTRSPIIWILANINNALLITTSNRSEGDVGYATMDGDTSGSIAPVSGIDKQFLRDWLKWAEKGLGYKALQHVNKLAPTAELRPQEKTQTDEDDLMPYAIMVEIETLALLNKKSPKEIIRQLIEKHPISESTIKMYVEKFFRLWSRNQWKRERTAPGFYLDEISIDPRSWYRFPILSGGFKEELND